MTTRARVLTTLVVVLGLATWEWCYLGWPRWFGTEIRVPVQVGTRGGPKGLAVPFYPEWHLQLDASNTQETGRPATPTVHVRSIGVVWNPQMSAQAAAASLRSRIAYLQLKGPAAGGDGQWHTESISLTPVPGSTNLRVRIVATSTAGAVAAAIDQGMVPPISASGNGSAILRLTASGRATIVGFELNGQRMLF